MSSDLRRRDISDKRGVLEGLCPSYQYFPLSFEGEGD